MHSNNTIKNELDELSPIVAGISNSNVFTVPEGYFETLPTELLISANPLQAKVPEGYFDNLADNILNKVRSVETITDNKVEVSPLLDSLRSISVFKVPEHYFDQLSTTILKQIPKPAVVIGINQKTSFFRYAIAAVITGILGMSLFTAFDKTGITDPAAANNVVIAQAGGSFDQMLETVSDEDIVHYLQNSGQDVNAALVASIDDEKTLPNPEDYLTDDQALDNILNGLNIKQTSNN